MRKRSPVWFALMILVLGGAVPIVPRLVVPRIRPFPYDDPFIGAGIVRIGPLVAWTLVPFVVLAVIAYVWLRRPALSIRHRAMVIGGVSGALVVGLVVGVWVHTPDPGRVDANIGLGLFPIYMLVLMPLGFGLGALLSWRVRGHDGT